MKRPPHPIRALPAFLSYEPSDEMPFPSPMALAAGAGPFTSGAQLAVMRALARVPAVHLARLVDATPQAFAQWEGLVRPLCRARPALRRQRYAEMLTLALVIDFAALAPRYCPPEDVPRILAARWRALAGDATPTWVLKQLETQ